MASSALPETLRSVTSTKIQELKKQRNQYEAAKKQIVRDAKACTDDLQRTRALLHGSCRQAGIRVVNDDSSDSESVPATDLAKTRRNQRLLLRQAGKDPAFASDLVEIIHNGLVEDLNLKSIQHQHAQFFSELVTEWLSDSKGTTPTQPQDIQNGVADSTFENVGRKEMHEQRAQWESLVFSPARVDESAIKSYLDVLFKETKAVAGAFKQIETSTHRLCLDLESTSDLFDEAGLKTTISGVLQSDLLSPEKAAILRSFKNNEDVLREVADVLNMRFLSLKTWQWTTSDGAIPVEQRRQLNGKYRVFMDEDVLDALLLHAIGMKFATHFKSCLTTFFHSHAWTHSAKTLPKQDKNRRHWFLGEDSTPSKTVEVTRRSHYENDYFMTQLPITEEEGARGYDGDGDSDDSTAPSRKSPVEIKQSLLHLVITEALVARHLRPGVSHAVIRSDFQWFGPSLPHGTIFVVLEFFGVTPAWLEFFRKFLQAPMRFVQDGPGGQAHPRQRGVPMSHALSDVFGEVILFVMDFAVNRATQSYLYRLHDDFWFWGTEDLCARGWEAMSGFASVMGIEFNKEKTGTVMFGSAAFPVQSDDSDDDAQTEDDDGSSSDQVRLPKGDVRWGFLRLDATQARFVIDQKMVDEHIEELQRQLSHCTSIFSWIQAYNAYLARFFSNNFGMPSYAFGREHIDDIIDTYVRIQKELFPDGSVTDHLAKLAEERFGITGVPDGVWYWPVQMGGFELRNPLVPLYCMRETIRTSPHRILTKQFEADEGAYISAKAHFEHEIILHGRLQHISASVESCGEVFMSKAEYLQYREERSINLAHAYSRLLEVPTEFQVHGTQEILAWLEKMPAPKRSTKAASSSGIVKTFSSMKPYWKWILAVYGAQIVEKYGSVQIVDAAYVPMGIVSVMKADKVQWQG